MKSRETCFTLDIIFVFYLSLCRRSVFMVFGKKINDKETMYRPTVPTFSYANSFFAVDVYDVISICVAAMCKRVEFSVNLCVFYVCLHHQYLPARIYTAVISTH